MASSLLSMQVQEAHTVSARTYSVSPAQSNLCVSAGMSWSCPPQCCKGSQESHCLTSVGEPLICELLSTLVLLSLVLMMELCDTPFGSMAIFPALWETSVSALGRS